METLFDTHAHLDFPAFDRDREQVITRAREAGVKYILNIGSGDGLECASRAVAIAEARDNIWASAGVHPHDAKLVKEGGLEEIRELCRREKVVAVGEIGLDYAKMHSEKKVQLDRFRDQLALARELSLPVIIHVRDAHDDMLRVIKDQGVGSAGGVMHCFSGSAELARQLARMGFYISFPGVITFKNARKLPEAVRAVPEDKILIETDCPFLAPEPHRGRRNEPAYVRLVAEAIARIKKAPMQRIAQITTQNAFAAFGLDK